MPLNSQPGSLYENEGSEDLKVFYLRMALCSHVKKFKIVCILKECNYINSKY